MGKKIEKVVEIEVGGPHGDGNVEVIRKDLGIRLIIRDFDNAELPEDAKENPETGQFDEDSIPETREWEPDSVV